MRKLTHGSLFSGIGGFDLAAEWMGWDNKFHCEWNEFGQKVLHHYWPNAESFTDITKTDFTKYANKIDILTGGFPCQPYSSAGKRKGKEDERHLWPEMLRAIREISPRFVVGENVRGLTNWNAGMVFEEVCAELESYGYQVAPVIIPACAVNAPHKRERIWFVAYSESVRRDGGGSQHRKDINQNTGRELCECGSAWGSMGCQFKRYSKERDATDANLQRCKQLESTHISNKKERFNSKEDSNSKSSSWENFPTQSPVCSGYDGLSGELDGITFPKWRNESIKAYGNAIVPQVAYQIFKAIEKTLYL
jgi:DNA (cytosine-5)-methyltransferase 1